MNPLDRDLIGWGDALVNGEATAVALLAACEERIARHDGAIRAISHLRLGEARDEAAQSDARRREGSPRGPLDGIPILVKDNIDLAGLPATAGMATRRDRMARADAFVIERLRAAGAVVFGKVTMHEGALGATNESPLTGRTYNPHRAGFTPGGSSGGSGAAVAAGFCLASLGTDTLGSVRIPAAYCGVVGHKPTKGLVGNRGVVPLSWTLDHVGPLTRSVRDAAAVLAVLAVFDPIDAGAEPAPVAATEVPALPDLRGVTLGRLVAADRVGLDPEVAAAWARALDVLRESGATLREVDLPPYDFGRARRAGLLIAEAEGAFAHAGDLAERAQLLSPALRAMLSFGRDAKTGALVKAQRLVADVVVQVRQAMAGVDALVLPTAPQPAFDFSRAVPDNQADLTSLASLTGRPAVSVPMGFSRDRLPLGLQLIGHPFGDGRLLAIAAAYEAAARWDMRPIL